MPSDCDLGWVPEEGSTPPICSRSGRLAAEGQGPGWGRQGISLSGLGVLGRQTALSLSRGKLFLQVNLNQKRGVWTSSTERWGGGAGTQPAPAALPAELRASGPQASGSRASVTWPRGSLLRRERRQRGAGGRADEAETLPPSSFEWKPFCYAGEKREKKGHSLLFPSSSDSISH